MNSLGIGPSSLASGGSGGRGARGISVSNITFQDLGDGTTDITFHMSDGTTYGPFGGSLINDNLMQLNKISIEGTNESDKFLVKDNSGNEVFKVDTSNGQLTLNGTLITGLTASQVVVTDESSHLTTLPYAPVATNNALVQYDSSGNINCDSLTANVQLSVTQNLSVGGTISCSSLANDRVVINNGSGLISTMEYATAATNNALVQREWKWKYHRKHY